LKDRGHVLTGDGLRSIESSVERTGLIIQGLIYMNDYLLIVDQGVKPSRIPYTRGRSRGRTSKYIQGLIKFFRLKGKSQKKAKDLAFATANVQEIEGSPTKASRRFSKTGKRTGFLSDVLDKELVKMIEGLQDDLFGELQQYISVTIEGVFRDIEELELFI